MARQPELFTPETRVFASGIRNVSIKRPITVYNDTAGHQAVSDGNHRAAKAYQMGKLDALRRIVIGTLHKDVSQDPNYRRIYELKIIED